MMNVRKLLRSALLSLVMCCSALSAHGERTPLADVAQDFFKQVSGRAAVAVDAQLSDNPNCVVFNMSEGGFVVVSTVDADQPIIGYALTGRLSSGNLAPAFKASLDRYVKTERRAPARRDVATRIAKPAEVAPLLQEVEWAQNYPFYILTPELNGEHCPTGCVATAMAQMMRYYRYPERGVGEASYTWNERTLSVDLSQSTYQWELMTPKYGMIPTGEEPTPEEMAVATLMRDVGYAVHMNYGPEMSGASHAVQALIAHFGYDKGARSIYKCTVQEDIFKEIIRDEIVQGRPVFFSSGGHYYLCDGYDNNGLFHFNYGWGGDGNGFFNVDAFAPDYTETSIDYGIQPDQGGASVSTCASDRGFVWNGKEYSLNYYHTAYDDELKTDFALAYRNSDTREVSFSSVLWAIRGNGTSNMSIPDRTNLSDGVYEVFPVYRDEGTEEWLEFYFADGVQNVVRLEVNNGERTYTNIAPKDKVYLDNLVYSVSEAEGTAALVSFISTAEPTTEIVIPATVDYEGKTYPVTAIADRALDNYPSYTHQISLTIGENVETIGTLAFAYVQFECVKFAPGSRLQATGSSAFNNATIKAPLHLPNGLKKLSWYSFGAIQQLDVIDIPASVEIIEGFALSAPEIQHIYVHWAEPLACDHPYGWLAENSELTLHVPAGTKELYAATYPWNQARQIVEDSVDGISETEVNADDQVTVYSLQGLKLLDQAPRSALKRLPAGLYIVNGRLVKQ